MFVLTDNICPSTGYLPAILFTFMYLNSVPLVVIRKLLYNFHNKFMYELFSPSPLESLLLTQNDLLIEICGEQSHLSG
jgi:hypothetical protein